MPTKEEIKAFYKAEHDRVTKAFYQDKTIDTPTFRQQHEQNWRDLTQSLLDAGYAQMVWRYEASATINTQQGPVTVAVAVSSPTQLSATQKTQYLQALKNASWAITVEKSEIVEIG